MANEPQSGKFYPRARKDWDANELQRLRLLIPYEYNSGELVDFFGRPKANIDRTISEMKSVLDPSVWPKITEGQKMLKPVLPSYGDYNWRGTLGELFPDRVPKPIELVVAAENHAAAKAEIPDNMKILEDIENGGKKVKRL